MRCPRYSKTIVPVRSTDTIGLQGGTEGENLVKMYHHCHRIPHNQYRVPKYFLIFFQQQDSYRLVLQIDPFGIFIRISRNAGIFYKDACMIHKSDIPLC